MKIYCDGCGRLIENPRRDAVMLWNVEFSEDGKIKTLKDFKIVHKRFTGYGCDDGSLECSASIPEDYRDALAFWLVRLDPKFNTSGDRKTNMTKIDLSVFEGIARTTLPDYEEARLHAERFGEEVCETREGYEVDCFSEKGIKKILSWARGKK